MPDVCEGDVTRHLLDEPLDILLRLLARGTPLLELLEGQLPVIVQVRLLEGVLRRGHGQLLGAAGHLLRRAWLGVVHDLIDGGQVASHLVHGDHAVDVVVLKGEGRHLLVTVAAAEHLQAASQLSKIDHAVAIDIGQHIQATQRHTQGVGLLR